MIYEYYSGYQERGRKPEPIDELITKITDLLNEGRFSDAESEIEKLKRRLERQTIKNPDLLKETLHQIDSLLQETFNQIVEIKDFESAAYFLKVFGRFFNPAKEGELTIPESLSSEETFKAAIREYVLEFLGNRSQFEWLINNFERLDLVNKDELIRSPEAKNKAIEILLDYLSEIESAVETVVAETKEIEKSIFFEWKYRSGTSEEEIKKLETKIEQGGIEQVIVKEEDLDILRKKALRRITENSPYFRELLNLKNRFFSRINSFVNLGIFTNLSEAINHPAIEEELLQIFKKYQDKFSNNRREIKLRIWLWKREKVLLPKNFEE